MVVHRGQEDHSPQVQGERAAWPVEPLSFSFGVCLFDVPHQKTKLLEGHTDGGSKRAGVLGHDLEDMYGLMGWV